MTDDNKYVVVKREEWDALLRVAPAMVAEHFPEPIPDAVVIRRQDVFAPPALDTYANAIYTAVEILRMQNGQHADEARRLLNIADYFHGQAVTAWQTNRKVPD